ncbi:chondroadherin-like [Cylas formicarius]|uniref:chondroadherin-like n=1 Tax=Cylas formicarius TaxID=197179 RepID=UPI00295884FF|nr:chondroadherin-like [Cylas formicarius]
MARAVVIGSMGLLLCGGVLSVCVDKFALSSVDSYVHKTRNSRAIKLESHNFNLLDDYIAVDVTRANVTQLCEGMIKNFPRLETLALINVNLSQIEPGAFENTPKLKGLSLSVNRLTRIENGIFNKIPTLRVIYLTRNAIETIEDGAFSEMPNLKVVHLDHNKIVELTGNIFFGSRKISFVDFSHNSIKEIDAKSFDDLRPGPAIKKLNILLKKNLITRVDKAALEGLSTPVDLHLEVNQIYLTSDIMHGVREGSEVYLNGNNIECIPDDVIDEVETKRKTLHIKGNPLNCECMKVLENRWNEDITNVGELYFESTLPCSAFPELFL